MENSIRLGNNGQVVIIFITFLKVFQSDCGGCHSCKFGQYIHLQHTSTY